MNTHTPGPWYHHEHETETARITNSVDQYTCKRGPWITPGIRIADIWATDLPGGAENARLIAAAPDLLAACEAIRSCGTSPESGEGVAVLATFEILSGLCAAIRRAKGES